MVDGTTSAAVSATGWTKFQIGIAVLMVTTGSLNTLAAKWADTIVAKGVKFDHPFMQVKRKITNPIIPPQAVCMFIGEFLCLPVFFALLFYRRWAAGRRRRSPTETDLGAVPVDPTDAAKTTIPPFNPLVMLPAAVCDMCATSVMYIGLNMTNAASFQMLRGKSGEEIFNFAQVR